MATTEMNADMVEDGVMNELPTLNAVQLEEVCVLIGLEVKEELRGKKRGLLKMLMRFLCTGEDQEDDKMTQFLQIHEHLLSGKEEAEAVKKEVTEEVPDEKQITETSVVTGEVKSEVKSEPPMLKSTPEPLPMKPNNNRRVQVTRLKDFKLSGMIGGDGESGLSLSSLEFEIEKARRLGHTDTEICGVVITKVADKELRKLFETEPDIDLDDVLDMLKSSNAEAKDSSAVFTEFTSTYQFEDEKVTTFIARLQRLRKEVVKLGKTEGVNYDLEMLAKRGFTVLFSGLRDENVRSALREKCKGDHNTDGKVLLKYAADIVALEKERKMKLFGKKVQYSEGAAVNALGAAGNDTDALNKKKEKINPFAKIEELRTEMKTELNEIKNLVVAHHMEQQHNGERRRKWKPGKCTKCTQENVSRCNHCWKCGGDNHKRGDCPTEN